MISKHERISVDPTVMFGKPVIRGTRIAVDHVLRRLGAGDDVPQILRDYPQLSAEDIRAVQAYAADVLSREDVLVAS